MLLISSSLVWFIGAVLVVLALLALGQSRREIAAGVQEKSGTVSGVSPATA